MGLEHLVQLRDVVLVQLLHDLHLALHRLAPVRLHQLHLLVDLDRDFLVQRPVQPKAHDGVGSLPDALSDEVVVQVLD